MIKSYFFVLFIFFHAFLASAQTTFPSFEDTVHILKTPFEPDLCLAGYAGSWTGACICNKKQEKPNRYCLSSFNKIEILPYIKVNDKTITLSSGITNWEEAKLFCTEIGDGFKLASRADFNCKQTGLGCLDNELFLPIKEKYGNRGFFWLEETEDLKKAYYADLNDGTIYNTSKSNSTTMQALCIKEDKK